MARPRTIHDFSGFPHELLDAGYRAVRNPGLAEIAAEEGSLVETLLEGHALGSISMTSYGIGAHVELAKDPTCAAKLPEGVPPDQSNI